MRHPLRLVLATLLLFLSTLGHAAALEAAPEKITFVLSPANKPPFWYQQEGQARGFVPELLQSVSTELGFELETVQVPRKRGIELIRKHPRILMGLASEWVPDPENFLFSDPISHTRDVFISHREDPVRLEQDAKTLRGEILGTHFGYHYPTLEPLFELKLLLRSDSHSEQALLERLQRKRIRVAVMTEAVARWYLAQDGDVNQLYIDQVVVAAAKLRLMAHPSEQPLIEMINRAIAKRIANGELVRLHQKFYLTPLKNIPPHEEQPSSVPLTAEPATRPSTTEALLAAPLPASSGLQQFFERQPNVGFSSPLSSPVDVF